MGYCRLNWCLLLLLVTSNSAIRCPENGVDRNGDYSGDCYVKRDTFEIKISTNKFVFVNCFNKSFGWSDFHVQPIDRAAREKFVIFRRCPLPNSLHEITQKMGVRRPNSLDFDWSDNLNSTLMRDQLRGFPELRGLSLSENNLTYIPDDLFEDLPELTRIELHGNKVRQLSAGIFKPVPKLETLELGNNSIGRIDPKLFSNLSSLHLLNLWGNQLSELEPDTFDGLSSLRSLDISINKLTRLPEEIFKHLRSLQTLFLHKNSLNELREMIFEGLKELRNLNLSHNELTFLPDNIFVSLGSLIDLNLNNNRLTIISSRVFEGLKSLNTLKIEHNELYGNFSLFPHCGNLKNIYLTHNNITEISQDLVITASNLDSLDLSYNKLSAITEMDLQFVSQCIKVNLTNNNIIHIGLKNVESYARQENFEDSSRDVKILVDHNPIHCDCEIYDFIRYLDNRMDPSVKKYFNMVPEHLKCTSPNSLKGKNISDLESKSFTCSESSDWCPENCTCERRPENKAFLIDCSYRNLGRAPEKLTVSNQYLIELNLTGNFLTEMPSAKRFGYQNISRMLLSHNNISNVSCDGVPLRLQELTLHNNEISEMNGTVLDFMKNRTSLKKLTLHSNPWKCNCEAREFFNFIQTKYTDFPELINVTCHGSNKLLINMIMSDLCPSTTGVIVGISLAVAVLGLAAGILAALYYRYQKEIKPWLYTHRMCSWIFRLDKSDLNKLFDAFFSYSYKDEWVVEEMVTELESGPIPYKLCVHTRNFVVGQWIPRQITWAIENSSRTIVVLSPNFVKSAWGRFEFMAAHRQALSEGRLRVIVILLGDIGPIDDLEPELKAYLRMNTYLKWGDPLFWEKLRFALPHRSKSEKRTAKIQIFEDKRPGTRSNGDRDNLLQPPGLSLTTAPVTTSPAESMKLFIPDVRVK